MAYRHVCIANRAFISLRNKQLVIKQDEEYTIPLSDISTVMLENNASTITSAAIAAMAENNIALFTCSEQHTPNGVLIPFNNHSRQLKALKIQLEASKPLVKRIWQKIVKQKILNQAKCIQNCDIQGWERLFQLSNKVESGDKNNIESQVARVYFRLLFGPNFIRRTETTLNASLNYGYSLIRAAIARSLTTYGFYPSIGLFHHNELNNFNLADDLIEPYRPLVDKWVYDNVGKDETILNTEHKRGLYNLFNTQLTINNGVSTLTTAIEITSASLVTALSINDREALKLPQLFSC